MAKWSEKERELLKEKYADTPMDELLALFPARSIHSIRNQVHLRGLKRSEAFIAKHCRWKKGEVVHPESQFKPGQKAWNKNTIGLMKPNKTSFKKGNRPANYKPVGTVTTRKDKCGAMYQYIKTEDGKWMPYHRFLWEQLEGPIPKGMILRCKSDDRTNCMPDNWEMIDQRTNALRNRNTAKTVAAVIAINSGERAPKPLTDYAVLLRLSKGDPALKEYLRTHRPDIIQAAKKTYELQRALRYGRKQKTH